MKQPFSFYSVSYESDVVIENVYIFNIYIKI